MAVTSDGPFISDGVLTDYNYTFDIDGSFNVVRVGVKSPEDADYVIQVEGTDYNHTAGSKLISFISGFIPANLDEILFQRVTSRDRSTDYIDGSTLPAQTLDNEANRSATVDEEIEDQITEVRQATLLVADMPTSGTPTTVDMGIEADLLYIMAKMDGTHDVMYAVAMPSGSDNRLTAGSSLGTGTTVAPELRFERNSDPTKVDLTFVTANDFSAWTEIRMIAMKFPVNANL